MNLIYHIIIGFVILVASPAIALRMVFDSGFRSGLLARLDGCKALEPLHGCLWIHAASVGEVRMAKILISALKKKGRPVQLLYPRLRRQVSSKQRRKGWNTYFECLRIFHYGSTRFSTTYVPRFLLLLKQKCGRAFFMNVNVEEYRFFLQMGA